MTLQDDFKQTLSCWASGVTVVTTKDGDLMYGLTVSSFTSLSLTPPLILVCLGNRNRLVGMIERSDHFVVNLLAAGQETLSNSFAKSGREPTRRFEGIGTEFTISAQPRLRDAIAHVSCKLHASIVEGDHSIVIGRVLEASAQPERTPLLYFQRRYRSLEAAETGAEPDFHFDTLLESF